MDNATTSDILVIGSGGREHALVRMCRNSPLAGRVIAAPGNGGMAAEVECFDRPVEDTAALVQLAREEKIDFALVGPEVPLSLGLVDALQAEGIPAYGPNKAAARLESSKAFCKDFLQRHNIPTAGFASFTEVEPALAYLEENPAPIVIKASGLAAGKGVVMANTREEAAAAVRDMLEGDAFGSSGREIVIEEMLCGEEASIHAIVSGSDYVCLPTSQDHKRVGEGDTGPNTGGMGAYAPAKRVDQALLQEIEKSVIRPTLKGLQADGIEFRGTLYAGLMLTESGPKVLEFNVRFGDPETQALLPLLADDLLPVCMAAAKGEPLPSQLRCHSGAAIVVVLAAEGYPGSYPKGESIRFPEAEPENTAILHAGTQVSADGAIVTAGGRVLGVSARGANLREAADRAYAVCDSIDFKSKYFRPDIGHRAFEPSS
ncbi:MAG: phosphoribosylamine--glycine ligase [Opitutales bacterium]